jgi:hypothetical protein
MNVDRLTQEDYKQLASIDNKGGIPRHQNGTVGVTPVNIVFNDVYAERAIILNTHATQNLLISFEAGGSGNYMTIFAKTPLILEPVAFKDFWLKGSGASTTYEMLLIY